MEEKKSMFSNCVLKVNVSTKQWFKKTLVRCVRTFASTALAVLPTTYATMQSVNWGLVFSTALLSSVIIFFTCVAGIPEVEEKPQGRDI